MRAIASGIAAIAGIVLLAAALGRVSDAESTAPATVALVVGGLLVLAPTLASLSRRS